MKRVPSLQLSSRTCVHFLLVLLLIVVAGSGMLASLRTVARANNSVQIQVSQQIVYPSQSISVSGCCFGVKELIVLTFDSSKIKATLANATGAFSTSVTVPGTALPGTHTIQASGQASGLSAQATLEVQTDWPQFGFDSSLTRFNPYENVINPGNVSNLILKWSYFTGNCCINSTPLVANGMVYVSSLNVFYAFDDNNGPLLWSYNAGYAIMGSSAVANGIVYFHTDNATLYALNASTGAFLWSAATGPDVTSLTVDNKVVYDTGGNSMGTESIEAFNAATGKLLWKYIAATSRSNFLEPAVVDGNVYAVAENTLYVLDATTGKLQWQRTIAPFHCSPVVANGVIYFAAGKKFFALSTKTHSILWTFPNSMNRNLQAGLAVANGIVYLNGALLYALNASDGTLLWSYSAAAGPSPALAVANGVIYFGSNGTFYALNANTGIQLWSYVTGPVYSAPSVANGVVYVGAGDGLTLSTLYAFHLPGSTLR